MGMKEYISGELKRVRWIFYGATAILALIGLIASEVLEPVNRPFYVNEATLWYPYVEDTVEEFAVAIYGAILLLILLIIEFFYASEYKQERYWVILRLFLNFAICIGMTYAFTEAFKLMAGELRPDFGYRCLGPNFIPPVNYSSMVIENNDGCVDTGYSLADGRKAFPSGHASMSFVVCIFSGLYLWHRSQIAAKKNFIILQQILFLALFIPFFISMWICVTRITDNKHEVADVVGGACLGALITSFIYFFDFPNTFQFYYPSDYSENAEYQHF